jgi:hypothetical protein
MTGSKPKVGFSSPLPSGDRLTFAVWSSKKDPTSDVLVIKVVHRAGNNYEDIGKLSVYRTAQGNYSTFCEHQPAKETQEQDEDNASS